MTRIIVYSSMNIVIALLVGISLLYTLGYRFDSRAQKVEQSGFVQYVSVPGGASIFVDGSSEGLETPNKTVVLPGAHEFSLRKTGYETWSKSLEIDSGTLTWLSYARLIPKERAIEPIIHLSNLSQAMGSPDKRFIATLPDATLPSIYMYDLTAVSVKQSIINLALADYTDAEVAGVTHEFVLNEWDTNGRFLLVEHRYGDKKEWLVVDRQDANLESNVSRLTDLVIEDAHFLRTDANQLFTVSSGELKRVNLLAGTVSPPLASHVIESHVVADGTVVYTAWTDDKKLSRHAGVVKNGKSAVILHTTSLDPTIPLHIAAGNYFHKDYVAISEGKKVFVYGGSFPEVQTESEKLGTPKVLAIMGDVTDLSMSPNGRFVLAGFAASYASYDIERNKLTPVIGLGQTSKPKKLTWLDDYYLWADQGGNLTLREFDGANAHVINSVASGFDVVISQNGTYLYSFGQAKTGLQLQRVKMIL